MMSGSNERKVTKTYSTCGTLLKFCRKGHSQTNGLGDCSSFLFDDHEPPSQLSFSNYHHVNRSNGVNDHQVVTDDHQQDSRRIEQHSPLFLKMIRDKNIQHSSPLLCCKFCISIYYFGFQH